MSFLKFWKSDKSDKSDKGTEGTDNQVNDIQVETTEPQIIESQEAEPQVVDPQVTELPKPKVRWGKQLKKILTLKKELDDDVFEEIETILLTADLGIGVTQQLISSLEKAVARKELNDIDVAIKRLKDSMKQMLMEHQRPLNITSFETNGSPRVVLVVGVNGVGKTTSIGKIGYRLKQQGHSVMLAAGDTFRAAASEQLQRWGESQDIPVIAQGEGSDSAAVIFDAIGSATSRKCDVIIADTAGRLHNKEHLMNELSKIKRVIAKTDETAPHEVLLVVDASTGQNAIHQAKAFSEAVNVTGLILTKMDGSAKGGIVLALANEFKLPIYFVGVGEKVTDLLEFDVDQYLDGIF